jgi:hypothetical protein
MRKIKKRYESLAKVLEVDHYKTLKFKTHGTMPIGASVTLSPQNTTFQANAEQTELRLEFTRAQLKQLGVLPTVEADATKEIAWFDLVKDAKSNLSDSRAFESANAAITENDKRGRAHKEGMIRGNGDRPSDKTFLIAGGAQLMSVQFGGSKSHQKQLADQADALYISGHGSYANGTISVDPESTVRFGASDAKWDADMEVVIIGGCSVLGIKTKKYRYSSMTAKDRRHYNSNYGNIADPSPGEAWENIKPGVKLGYCYSAPLDIQGSPGIVSKYQDLVNTGVDPVAAWGQANAGTTGVNACAIDTRKTPHEYWYFQEVSTGVFSTGLQWTKVTKGSAGW